MLTRKMPSALVYGGSGALGRAIVSHFRNADWNVVSLDFSNNPDASSNIVLEQSPAGTSLAEIGNGISDRVANALGSDQKLDAILTVAGGWAGGNLVDKDLLGNTELMITQSIYSSVISAKLAATYLKEGGLLTLTGASAATHGTPDWLWFGQGSCSSTGQICCWSQQRTSSRSQSGRDSSNHNGYSNESQVYGRR
ncbi:hypothetical protein QVD99_003987 [Batrachochytrium dendrobatidis]|nr:hypothetical protein QVD99_003987 [Batrachochytrium dendrobatidis]